MILEKKNIMDFFEHQLSTWDLASVNYECLSKVKKKFFKIKDLKCEVQFNPERAKSTLANLQKEKIKDRECFLCKDNRPIEQKGIEILPGWELLINPYPILTPHFTIVSKQHTDQQLNPSIGFELVYRLKGMVVFYNDAGAGASAPDHMHFQAVSKEDLPLN